jgi:hypothetical protein
MLIKSQKRIASADGNFTYKIFGIVFNMHNRFFSGQVVIKFKYGYRDTVKSEVVRHDVAYGNSKGFNTKYLELTLVSIKKVK